MAERCAQRDCGRGYSTRREPDSQLVCGTVHAHTSAVFGEAQSGADVAVRLLLEVAQEQRVAICAAEFADGIVNDRAHVRPIRV